MPNVPTASLPQLSAEMRDRLRRVDCSARIEVLESLDSLQPAEQVALASVEEAAGPPVMTNGQPTIARVVAWMVHEGVNRNRQGFVKEELQVAAQKIGLPDYPLVMDFNHAAIRRPEGAQLMCGVWHQAEFAFDPKAADGAGAWGILVQGVLFSWLFPDIANTLLAEQARNGTVAFSMACMAGSVEYATDAAGKGYEILHNPVFFTNAVLDVAPADQDALGLMTEGETDPMAEQDMMQKLCSDEVFKAQVNELIAAALATREENLMPNEPQKPTLTIAQGEPTTDGVVVVTAAMTLSDSTVEEITLEVKPILPQGPRVAELEAALAAERAAKEILEAKLAELEPLAADATKVVDLTSALEAAKAAAEELTAQVTELAGMNEQLATRVAEIDAEAAKQAAAVKLAARLAELPAAFKAKHEAKEDAARATIEAQWAAKSDEEWTEFVALLKEAVGTTAEPGVNTASYRARSVLEGILPVPSSTSSASSISERVHKVLHS